MRIRRSNGLSPEAEFIDTDIDADKLGVLDRIVHVLPETDVVLVDNRATGGSKVLAYLDETRLPELQAEFDCVLIFVVIATDDRMPIRRLPNCSTHMANA